ncbi:hypothetical protein EMCRGX_G025003 [Ephydatia muelleri]|eukprot:Em0015g1151a
MAAVDTLCDLCGIYTSSEEQLRQHLEGRRHLALLQRVETARRSIYVRGFPSAETKYSDLKSLFERFGSVVQVALDDKKFFAIVEFTSVDGALQVLRSPDTLTLHGKRLVVKPREAKLTSTKAPLEVQGSTCSSESMETVAAEQPSAPFSSRVELPPDLLSQLQQASTTTAQMELVAANYQMSEEGMKAQCEVCAHLRRMFPRSLVILFGSVVSGHAFVTSDCDVCILTDPSPRDMEDFDPTRYYNQQLLRIWHSTLYSGPGLQEAGGTCLPAAPQQWVTHFQQGAKSSSPLFDVILSCLQSDTRFTRVVPIPFARCPIVRFFYDPSSLHTDVSIDNRLGPYNTRLIRAYCEFDARFYTVLSSLRLWMRVTGIKRAQLHNYALTLMLIQALQCADPPVLPCLQDPGAWPVNMAWFAQGFAPTTNRPTAVGGWHCSFTPPGSLMHSKNTQSPAILLAHFFHFYSEVFDLHTHCVTIHINPSRRLTIEEAMRLAQESNPACRVSHFREGQLCIQDPFELSHNVAKSLSRDALVRLVGHCGLALQQLRVGGDSPSLLAVFRAVQLDCSASEGRSLLLEKSVHLAPDDMPSVLAGVQEWSPLPSHLLALWGELDHSSAEVRRKLSLAVLHAVVLSLEHTLGFSCVALCGSPPGMMPAGEVVVGGGQSESFNSGDGPGTLDGSEDGMQVESNLETVDVDGVRKRQRDVESDEEEEGEDGSEVNEADVCKKPRVGVSNDAMATLDKVVGRGLPPAYTCVAYSNTWVHRRQARRHKEGDPAVRGTAPVLGFTLTVDSADCEKEGAGEYIVKFTLADLGHLSDFHSFYAFFKKYLCKQR